jgi:hypothetical protein
MRSQTSRLTALAVIAVGFLTGGPATAVDVPSQDVPASKPQPTVVGRQVSTEVTGTTPASPGSTPTVTAVVDPCTETQAYTPAVGGGGVMVPLIVDSGGLRYAVFHRYCPGNATTEIRWYQIMTPAELAAVARQRVVKLLPVTKPVFADPSAPWQFVKVPTIVWVDPTGWKQVNATATALGTWSSVTVTPIAIRFDPGDGDPAVRCLGAGVPYTDTVRYPQDDRIFRGEPGQCGYLYDHSSKDAPDLKYPASVAVEWSADWQASDGTSGTLAPILITTPVGIKVARVQAIAGSSPIPPNT